MIRSFSHRGLASDRSGSIIGSMVRNETWPIVVGSVWMALSCVSCISARPTPLGYGVRAVRERDGDAVFRAADEVLTSMGYPVVRREPLNGVLVSRSQMGSSDAQEPDSRGASRLQDRYRRVVELRITSTPDVVKVYCKVAIEAQATRAHLIYSLAGRGDDLPGQTAIDRDAATTTEQNTVWAIVRRDKTAERAILAAIVERTGGEH